MPRLTFPLPRTKHSVLWVGESVYSSPETFKMPSISYRMRALQNKLLAIRLGSGALVLPKEVKRIHMRFARRIEGGHLGPR